MNHLGISEGKVGVVPLAADKRYKPPKNKEKIQKELEKKYNLKFPFLLYVGRLGRRKKTFQPGLKLFIN